MDIDEARDYAHALLTELLKSQPTLIAGNGAGHVSGAYTAGFCSDFIETYAANLVKQGTRR
jgi:hypothetical protein